jgi:soluble lytic murein transglycosylase-like protein
MPVFAESASPSAPAVKVTTVVHADAKTGRLIRTTIASVAKATTKPATAQLNELVNRIADKEGVEAPLVHSVILAESNYNPSAVSPKGALGIMQLIPSTARRFGVSDPFDPADNIQGGVRYLRYLLDYYHDDYTKSIAAYNAGEAAVDKYNGVPPYAETLGYVRTVAKHLDAERKNQAASTPTPAANSDTAEKPASAEPHQHIQAELGADGLIYYKTP